MDACALRVRDGVGRPVLFRPIDATLTELASRSQKELDETVAASERELGARESPQALASALDARPALPEELVESAARSLVEDSEGRERLLRRMPPAHVHGTDPVSAVVRHLAAERHAVELPVVAIARARTFLTMTGRVLDESTGEGVPGATVDIWQYDQDWNYVATLPSQTSDSAGAFAVGVDPGYVIVRMRSRVGPLAFVPPPAYAEVRGNATITVFAFPAVSVSGRVRGPAGETVPGARVTASWRSYSDEATSDSAGRYALLVPRERPLTVDVFPPPPYARAMTEKGILFGTDGSRDFTVERGFLLAGTVRTSDLGAPGRIELALRHLSPSSYKGEEGTTAVTLQGPGEYAFAVPRWLAPRTFLLSVAADGYVRENAVVEVDEDLQHDVLLTPGISVSGTVQDTGAQPLTGIRVRAFRGEELAASYLSDSEGHYALTLEPGSYRLRAEQECPATGCTLAVVPVEIDGLEVSSALVRDITLPAAEGMLVLRLRLQGSGAAEISQIPFRVEVRRHGTLVHAGHYRSSSWSDSTSGRHVVEGRLALAPGSYALGIHVLGQEPVLVDDLEVSTSTTRTIDLPPALRWTGILHLADGTPVPGTSIRCQDDLTYQSAWLATDDTGAFDIPITPDGITKFYAPERGRSILRVERHPIDARDRAEDLRLDELVTLPDSAGALTQIYGVASRTSRYNIVFIGDGYTTLHETFTDSNHNGTWDGILFGDTNQNGLLDRGEPYARYGSAPEPSTGTDPTRRNEPFVDGNGDGYPNLDDQAVLYRNAVDTLRSLFGQDIWSAARDTFNAYLIRVTSRQAGNDVIDASGSMLLTRDTFFDARVTLERNLLEANYDLIDQVVHEFLPEVDIIVAMVNQPYRMGRANSFILTQGGPSAAPANAYVIAHEMGHNLGLLRDEYTEFEDAYLDEEPRGPNITTADSLEEIPWRDLIAPETRIPSVAWSSGVGLFEGAYYHTAGAYRPTQFCMMVKGDRYCPVCTREVLLRLSAVTGGPLAAPVALAPQGSGVAPRPTFSWSPVAGASSYLVELRRVPDGTLVTMLDVFDSRVTPGLDLGFETRYVWRVAGRVEAIEGPWSAWLEIETVPRPRHYPRRHLLPR